MEKNTRGRVSAGEMEGGEKYRGRVSAGEMEGGEKRKKKLNYSSRTFPKTEIKL